MAMASGSRKGSRTVTLFVNNLPPKQHWRLSKCLMDILWQMYDCGGEIKKLGSGRKYGWTTLMVATSKWSRINEEVEVEIGKEIFKVYIAELTASTSRSEEQISGEMGKVSVAAETETEASSSSGGTVESDWRSQKQGL
ncbi:hypothetical protein V6N13_102157 [Hibiscus sabdariffa]